MSDRCCSTLICAKQDTGIFEKMGYTVQDVPALAVEQDDIPGAVVMVAEEAANGNYDELTGLAGPPFTVSNGSCRGTFGDHVIVSNGERWHYSEALHESMYPAVRVGSDGTVQQSEMDDARKYWAVYKRAVAAIRNVAAKNGKAPSKATNSGR